MTLQAIDRVSNHSVSRYDEGTRRRIRFASHRLGEGYVLVIWVGPEFAEQIGLDRARACVDIFLDDDFANTRLMGVRVSKDGQFRAARRGQNVGIYLNGDSFEHYFGKVWFHELADERTVTVNNGLLQFVAPVSRPRSTPVHLRGNISSDGGHRS